MYQKSSLERAIEQQQRTKVSKNESHRFPYPEIEKERAREWEKDELPKRVNGEKTDGDKDWTARQITILRRGEKEEVGDSRKCALGLYRFNFHFSDKGKIGNRINPGLSR